MRDYDKVTQAVLRRRDEQIAKDKRKAMIVKYSAAAAAFACCTAAVIGKGMYRYNNAVIPPEINNVAPAETTPDQDQMSTTTAYDTNKTTRTTTALSGTVTETTRKRADTLVTSSVTTAAFCTVTTDKKLTDNTVKNSAVTSSPIAAVPVVATTAAEVQPDVPIHEVRVDMQRIPVFLSALTASVSNVISNVNTEYYVSDDRYPNQKNGIENIRKLSMLTDLDSNGKSDLEDCRLLYQYCSGSGNDAPGNELNIPQETVQLIAENADYNQDGKISSEDADILVCFCLINNRVTYSDVSPAAYGDPDSALQSGNSSESSFAYTVSSFAHKLMIDHYIIEDMVDKDIIDLDVNKNGNVDIEDFTYLKINGDNYLDNYIVPVEGGYTTAPRPNAIVLPDNIKKNCDAVYLARPFVKYEYTDEVSCFLTGLEDYFASHMTLMPEFFENDFYESIVRYAKEYSIGDSLYYRAVEIGVIPEEDSYFHFDNEVFENGFKTYCENVASGKQAAPDINMDGAVDHKDYAVASDYIFEVAANTNNSSLKIPADVWKNINSSCDFNQNGTSGDIYDIFFTQMYVLLTNDEDINDTPPDKTDSQNTSNIDPYALDGDVNCDGTVDMADAVLIMQYLSNPNKFQLTDRGRLNGDIDGKNNGITLTDVLAIQNRLLNHKQNYTE
ncbi:dockerin type I repeat-containing protein [Ruminococcus sp.]|uniref:dockerin type I repeat-containing protein n=1 Tax=Ruminococcus sp. TaxID=41978 RepID=UPI0025F4F597|nr:dockerin type I repeat-containing protein [Ruminococcus sp.]